MKKVKTILFNGNCDADLRMDAATSYCPPTLRMIAQLIQGDKRERSAGALQHSDRRGGAGAAWSDLHPPVYNNEQTHILPLGFGQQTHMLPMVQEQFPEFAFRPGFMSLQDRF